MASQQFTDRLNEQIGHEFGAHQQYVAIAAYYDGETLPQMAALFYAQAAEERDHAMMMVQYLLDQDAPVRLPAIPAPRADFATVVEPVELALAQERRVTDQISELTRIARETQDYQSEQFMQWFLKEQVEEVSKMSDLVAVAKRNLNDVDRLEEWVAREDTGEAGDPTAPPIAGA